jgi:membrane protease YdiL (CAAX protease family)
MITDTSTVLLFAWYDQVNLILAEMRTAFYWLVMLAMLMTLFIQGEKELGDELDRPFRRAMGWLLGPAFFLLVLANLQLLVSHAYAPFQGHSVMERYLQKKMLDYLLTLLAVAGAYRLYQKYLADQPFQIATWQPDQEQRGAVIRYGLMVGLAGTCVAFAVFFNFNYQPSWVVKEFNKLFAYYIPEISQFVIFSIMVNAVILEELIYRFIIQGLVFVGWQQLGRPDREAAWMGILVSALMWTWAHDLSFEFAWAKYLQIFPFGIMIGWLMVRYGLWACIMAHFVHNAIILGYSAVFVYLPPLD